MKEKVKKLKIIFNEIIELNYLSYSMSKKELIKIVRFYENKLESV